jgi:hypothetical protein
VASPKRASTPTSMGGGSASEPKAQDGLRGSRHAGDRRRLQSGRGGPVHARSIGGCPNARRVDAARPDAHAQPARHLELDNLRVAALRLQHRLPGRLDEGARSA